ncbi:MAG: hypothetical protein JJT96_12485 [Opitutales bacterium]|nr:hypothetical protein [Opitutales bacterium]
MIPLPRLIPKAARLSLAVPLFLPLIVHGSDLVRISSGNWHQADGWLDGDVSTNWIQGRGAWIPTGRSVSVNASTTVSDLRLDGVVTPGANPLTITGNLSGEGTFAMPNLGTSGAGVNGLVFATGAPIEMRQNVTLADQTNGRIVISAMDAGTEVTFNGFWDGWGSNTTHNLFVSGGARFLFGPEARVNNQMRDIIRARAFFARGDGHPDNVLEFHADFNADMGTAEQPVGGLSTLRVGDMTLITNATRNLPTIHKRLSNGGPTHHGLLIFDQGEGAHWIVRSQNQEYDGGIFWSRNWTLTAETDLLSIPVNRPGEDVGFGSTTPGTTLTKRGPGTLILDDAQGYVFNSTFLVEEGAVVFLTDPFQTWPGGRMVNAGNHLSLLLTGGGQVAFEAPTGQTFHVHHITAMDAATVRVGPGRLAVSETLSTPAGTTLQVVLGVADEVLPKVTAGELAIGGVLAVEAGDGFGAGQYRLFPASADGTVAPFPAFPLRPVSRGVSTRKAAS